MTDIFATLGPACDSPAVLKEMLGAGMTGLRLNLNHGRLSETMPLLFEVREAARFFGTELQLLIDLQGRSLRVGALPQPVTLTEGEETVLGKDGIPVPLCLFDPTVAPESFSLCDGRIRLKVLEKRPQAYLCRVVSGGILESRKGLTVPGFETSLPALTEQDREAIACAKAAGISAVMVPFVTGAEQLIAVREALDAAGCREVRIWAKLENRQGLDSMPEWLRYADMCVIARGDLGNAFSVEKVPALQKFIAGACRRSQTPFLVATGLLRSLMHEAQPSRADISDIYNAVLDGASGLMLTDETALGARPVLSVRYLTMGARAAEQDPAALIFS